MARTPIKHKVVPERPKKLKVTTKLKHIAVATLARKHGAKHARTIADEATRAGITYTQAFALVEQESGFRNVFGHDKGGMFPGLPVNASRVRTMVAAVHHGSISNGVGFTQLTWVGYLDEAERMGGAYKVRNQCRVGFHILTDHHKSMNWHDSYKAYNGAGAAADIYAHTMDVRVEKWHNFLKGWFKDAKKEAR